MVYFGTERVDRHPDDYLLAISNDTFGILPKCYMGKHPILLFRQERAGELQFPILGAVVACYSKYFGAKWY